MSCRRVFCVRPTNAKAISRCDGTAALGLGRPVRLGAGWCSRR
jgi:hypothetical protein